VTLASTACCAGGMPDAVIATYQKLMPSGRPNEAATAAYLRKREAEGVLGQPGQFLLDTSQMQAVATAVLNPLCLLHGPPGTGDVVTGPYIQWEPGTALLAVCAVLCCAANTVTCTDSAVVCGSCCRHAKTRQLLLMFACEALPARFGVQMDMNT
jgi:hypothetical protein